MIALFFVIIGVFAYPASAQQFGEPDHDIRGGKVLGFEINSEDISLIIPIDARTNGELIITLPRNLIDAKQGGEDIEFEVLLDGLAIYFLDETVTESDRTLTIPFSKFNNEITIIGTQVFSRVAPTPTSTAIPEQIENKIRQELTSTVPEGKAKLLIFSDTDWSGALQASGFDYTEMDGLRDKIVIFPCETSIIRQGVFGAKFEKMTEKGYLKLVVIQDQKILEQRSTKVQFGEVTILGDCASGSGTGFGGGGCLIATATYGSELAPKVQQLRELRDNSLLQTGSGSAFMESFNQLYYSFSPTIADWERQSPVFKELVKITITPLITSLSLLNYVDIDSEESMLSYGISIILLNIGMYFVAPAILLIKIKKIKF